MTTASVKLKNTYSLITSETTFLAQSRAIGTQEWVRAASLPAETVQGIRIEPLNGFTSEFGTGNLYGRGAGIVVVIT